MESIRAPEPPNFTEGDVLESWKDFCRRFQIYQNAIGYESKGSKQKASLFLHIIGKYGNDIYETFEFVEEGDKWKLPIIIEKFEEYFSPRVNITIQRHLFNSAKQEAQETFDKFLIKLKTFAKTD